MLMVSQNMCGNVERTSTRGMQGLSSMDRIYEAIDLLWSCGVGIAGSLLGELVVGSLSFQKSRINYTSITQFSK